MRRSFSVGVEAVHDGHARRVQERAFSICAAASARATPWPPSRWNTTPKTAPFTRCRAHPARFQPGPVVTAAPSTRTSE